MAEETSQKRSMLAIVSLVLGILSCLCFPAPIGLVCGVIALVQISRDPKLRGRNLAIAGVVLSVVFGGVAMLAMMALPSFITFGARSKQAECKSLLKTLYTSAKENYADKDKYTADFASLFFKPPAGRRYAYVTATTPLSLEDGRTVILPDTATVSLERVREVLATVTLTGGVHPGVEGVCPDDCSFTAMCVGNIDTDADVDVWSISTKDREAEDGTQIGAGMPVQEVNDLGD